MTNKTFALNSLIEGLPEQKKAITSASRLTVVSAGAGTGKTHTLSQRFAWLLASDPDCKINEILVLTFTEKAALEMRGRIADTVKKWSCAAAGKLPHLAVSAERTDEACISTIHSFGMKVIRESGLSLNIDPAAAVVSDIREELWWKELSDLLDNSEYNALMKYLPEEWKKRAKEVFTEQFTCYVNALTPDVLSKLSRRAADKLGSCGMAPEELYCMGHDRLLKDIADKRAHIAEKIWDEWFCNVFPNAISTLRSCHKELPPELCELFDRYHGANTEDGKFAFAVKLIWETLGNLNSISKNVRKAIADKLGMPLKDWRNKNRSEIASARIPDDGELLLLDTMNKVAAIGWKCWDSIRVRESYISHNDMIKYAVDAIKNTENYGKRFKHILIDEFQDTDAIQDMILQNLMKSGSRSLFVVGDLKQSIYRFRYADLTIFQKYIAKAKNAPSPSEAVYITLDKSFRTNGELLGKINSLFSRVWRSGLEPGSGMMYEAITAAANKAREDGASKRTGDPMEILIAVGEKDNENKKESLASTRQRLFEALACRIFNMHEAKEMIWDKANQCYREVTWSDFALLVPGRNYYLPVERAFDSIGVPYVLHTAKSYYSRREVSDVINLISLLADPKNKLAEKAWIASPFSGISCGAGDYPEITGRAEKKLAYLRVKACMEGAASVITELCCDESYLKNFVPYERGNVIANLSELAEIAHEYRSAVSDSLLGCAEYLNGAVKKAAAKEEPNIWEEDCDKVKVMTIHTAKGLEFPIVAVAGASDKLGGKSSGDTANGDVSRNYGVLTSYLPDFLCGTEKRDQKKNVSWLLYSGQEKKSIASEEERLWYVALTRAGEKVLICGCGTAGENEGEICIGENTLLRHIYDIWKEQDGFARVSFIRSQYAAKQCCRLSTEAQNVTCPLELKLTEPAALARMSASAYAAIAWCPVAYRLLFRQGMDLKWQSLPQSERSLSSKEGIGGAEFGSLTHYLFSLWNFDRGNIEEILPCNKDKSYEKILNAMPEEICGLYENDSVRGEIRRLMLNFSETEDGGNLARVYSKNPEAICRETPFRVKDGDLLLVGSTDIFWKENCMLQLRDWKTAEESAAACGYYEKQLEFYAYALWKECGAPSDGSFSAEAGICYLKEGTTNKRVFKADGLGDIGDEIHAAAVRALSGTFTASLSKCSLCPWRKACPQAMLPNV